MKTLSDPSSQPKFSTAKKLGALALTHLAAASLHFYLAYQHYNLRFGNAQPSLCNINSTFDCDVVAASRFSELLGFPLALWGAIVAILLLVWSSLLGALREPSADSLRKLLWGQAFVALMSVIMAVINVTQLSSYCVFCLLTYGLSWAGLGLAWASQVPTKSDFVDLLKGRDVWGSVLAVPVLVWLVDGVLLRSFGGEQAARFVRQATMDYQSEPVIAFAAVQGPVLRKGQGQVEIVEFADFLCPHCKVAARTLGTFVKAESRVRVSFHPFPLDGECNSIVQQAFGTRCQLGRWVLCAEQSGKGWALHDLIFDNQEELLRAGGKLDVLDDALNQAGFDRKELDTCADSAPIRESLKAQIALGVNAKIQGTPAIFVNGRYLRGGQNLQVLREVVGSAEAAAATSR